MPLGLRQVQSSLLDSIPEGDYTSPPPGASFAEGALTAIPRGVAEGEIKLGGAVAAGASSAIEESPYVKLGYQTISGLLGAEPETDEQRDDRIRQNTQDLLDHVRSTPATTGTAAQVLTGLASGLTELTGGGPLAVGVGEGVASQREQLTQGVDKATADRVAGATALFSTAGAMLPGGYGKTLLQRVLSGSAAQGAMGIASRASSSAILADAGYDKQASQYRALDAQAILADTVLGAGFGAVHHLFAPSVEDAARTTNDSVSVESRAPGVPIDANSRQNHVDNMDAATKALIEETDLHDLKDVQTVPNPAAEAVSAEMSDSIAEAGRELTGEPTEPAVEQNRRADDIAAARMAELRSIGDKRTPAETAEYAKLLEEDRLAAKVGGRRIQGVLNDDAYAEMLGRGEAKPVQGFVDMDMLKALNDTYGHGAGDHAIRTLGETLAHYFGVGNVFRRSSSGAGDEFLVQSTDQATHDAAVAAARQHMSNHILESTDTAGEVRRLQGIGFSHGSGKTAELAEQAAYADKQLRKSQGLRTDRGSVAAEPPAANREPARDQAAGAKTGSKVTSAVDAVSKLTQALKRLVASKGTDQNAHDQVRGILDATTAAGHDAAAVERAAIARAGEGAAEAVGQAKASERATADTGTLDPETREAVDAAQAAVERSAGELQVEDPATGQQVSARDALNAAIDRLKNSDTLATIHQIAAACFGR